MAETQAACQNHLAYLALRFSNRCRCVPHDQPILLTHSTHKMNQRSATFSLLRTLHITLLAGLALFAVVALIITKQAPIAVLEESTSRILQVISVISSIAFLVIGFNIFKRKILAARNSTGEAEARLKQYASACVLWWAMIEAPGVVAIVCYLLTGNLSFFVLAAVHILILLAFMPRKENIIVLLNFSSQDVSKLEGDR